MAAQQSRVIHAPVIDPLPLLPFTASSKRPCDKHQLSQQNHSELSLKSCEGHCHLLKFALAVKSWRGSVDFAMEYNVKQDMFARTLVDRQMQAGIGTKIASGSQEGWMHRNSGSCR